MSLVIFGPTSKALKQQGYYCGTKSSDIEILNNSNPRGLDVSTIKITDHHIEKKHWHRNSSFS